MDLPEDREIENLPAVLSNALCRSNKFAWSLCTHRIGVVHNDDLSTPRRLGLHFEKKNYFNLSDWGGTRRLS